MRKLIFLIVPLLVLLSYFILERTLLRFEVEGFDEYLNTKTEYFKVMDIDSIHFVEYKPPVQYTSNGTTYIERSPSPFLGDSEDWPILDNQNLIGMHIYYKNDEWKVTAPIWIKKYQKAKLLESFTFELKKIVKFMAYRYENYKKWQDNGGVAFLNKKFENYFNELDLLNISNIESTSNRIIKINGRYNEILINGESFYIETVSRMTKDLKINNQNNVWNISFDKDNFRFNFNETVNYFGYNLKNIIAAYKKSERNKEKYKEEKNIENKGW